MASSRGASHKTKLKGDLSRPVPQCPHQTPPLPGPPCSYPPLRAWSREEKEVGKKKKRERNPNSTAQQNKESRERMTRSVGNCVHRGAGPNGKSPTPRAPPPAARGEGRPRPLSEGPVSPRPARGPGAAGRRRRREGRPGVRGAGGLHGITSCRRRRISGISPTLLRPPKTNAPTHTHSHTLGPGSVSSRSFFFFFFLNQIFQSPNKMVFQKNF